MAAAFNFDLLPAETKAQVLKEVRPDTLAAFKATSWTNYGLVEANIAQRTVHYVKVDLFTGRVSTRPTGQPRRKLRRHELRNGRVGKVRILASGGNAQRSHTAARRLYRYRHYLAGARVTFSAIPNGLAGEATALTTLLLACKDAIFINVEAPPTRSTDWFAQMAGDRLHHIHTAQMTRIVIMNPFHIVDWLLSPSNTERAIALDHGCTLTYEVIRHLIIRVLQQGVRLQHAVELHVRDPPVPDYWGILPSEADDLQMWMDAGPVRAPDTGAIVHYVHHGANGATLRIEP